MNKFVVIIGMGELGEIFARGFLKLGYPVYPVLRSMQFSTVVSAIPEPELVLLAVGEDDFHPQLEVLPDSWRGKLVFLQNELLPHDWGVIILSILLLSQSGLIKRKDDRLNHFYLHM